MRSQESTSMCDIKFKVVFLGDMGVGKTSIIQRFVKDEFQSANNPTIGIDFLCRNITYNQKTYRVQLWDTAGQQKYKSLVPAYLRDANCAVFVIDVTRSQSLENLRGWVQLFRDHEKKDSKAILMANKVDMVSCRVISEQTISNFSKRQGLIFWQVSAKSGEGISDCFNQIIRCLSCDDSLKEQQDENIELSQKFFDEYDRIKRTSSTSLFSCCYI